MLVSKSAPTTSSPGLMQGATDGEECAYQTVASSCASGRPVDLCDPGPFSFSFGCLLISDLLTSLSS